MNIELKRKPASAKIQYKAVQNEVRKRLKPVAINAVKARDRVVSNWSNKPGFKYTIQVAETLIAIIIDVRRAKRLKNSKFTVADLWKWIDKTGTKAHLIKPKKAGGILAFQDGKYQSKTSPNPARFGGPGMVTNGRPVFTRLVKHPGFKARKFSEAINKDTNDDFSKAIKNGYEAGFKRVK